LNKAVERNPKNIVVYYQLGKLCRIQGRFSEAENLFKKALDVDPKNVRVYLELGWLYIDQNRFSEAEELFKKALGEKLLDKDGRIFGALSILYKEMGRNDIAEIYQNKKDASQLNWYADTTVDNYRRIKKIIDDRGIRLVCVQYPNRRIEPLMDIFDSDKGVVFVDNKKIFEDVLKAGGCNKYFRDFFGGDFGHCTEEGNRLLAENIADVIIRECFDKKTVPQGKQ
jgi:tetratricopeptide (TPR) repeat protein